MADDVRSLGDAILLAHKKLGHDLDALLRPGLTQEEISALTSAIPFRLPSSVTELFAWRNGTRTGVASFSKMWFFPGWHMLSLDAAVEAYRMMMADEWGRWNESWFPIFASPGCDFHAARCENTASLDAQIIDFENESPDPPVEIFSGLNPMLRTILAAFESGLFFIDETGMFNASDAEFMKLRREIDPPNA